MSASRTPPPPHLAHIPALDGVRGLAILLVLPHNTDILSDAATDLVSRVLLAVLNGGWVGVQLFFVLSGFLITRILLASQGSPHYFKHFYAKRALRILPLYVLVLCVVLYLLPALGVDVPNHEQDLAHQGWLWLFLSNWSTFHVMDKTSFPHFWSLAVEEQFYWVWPLLVWKLKPRQVVWVCGVIALASFGMRHEMLRQGLPDEWIYDSTVGRLDALALGSALGALTLIPSVWQRIQAVSRWRWWLMSALLLLACQVVQHIDQRTSANGQLYGYAMWTGVFTLFIAGALNPAETRSRQFLTWRPLVLLGQYSYCMYLVHKPLHDIFGKPWLLSHGYSAYANDLSVEIPYLIGIALLTFVIAAVSFHTFERFFLSKKALLH